MRACPHGARSPRTTYTAAIDAPGGHGSIRRGDPLPPTSCPEHTDSALGHPAIIASPPELARDTGRAHDALFHECKDDNNESAPAQASCGPG